MNAVQAQAFSRLAEDASLLDIALKTLYETYPDPCGLLGKEVFTLLELQHVHEGVLDRELSINGFRRRMTRANLVVPTGEFEKSGEPGKPAQLFRINPMYASERPVLL